MYLIHIRQVAEFKEQLLFATGIRPERILEFSCGKFNRILFSIDVNIMVWYWTMNILYLIDMNIVYYKYHACRTESV